MGNLSLVEPPDDRPKVEPLDWKTVAPKSLLLAALFLCTGLIGAMANEIRGYWSQDRQRSENSAIHIAGLNIRVASVESDMKSIPELKKSVDNLNVTVAKLVGQVELLTARLPLK